MSSGAAALLGLHGGSALGAAIAFAVVRHLARRLPSFPPYSPTARATLPVWR